MEFKHGVLALTANKDVLERLRRLGTVRLDAAKNKFFYTAQFDGQFIRFYEGEPRTFPLTMAQALENSNHTFLDEKCIHCKGQGSTVAGICINCKGKKLLTSDKLYRTLKILRTYDAMLVDPATLAPLAPNAELEQSEAPIAT